MVKNLAVLLVSAGFIFFTAQAASGDYLNERSTFYPKDSNQSEVVFEVHHPGLVRWIEDGREKGSYTVPGCFHASEGSAEKGLVDQFFDGIVIENITHGQSPYYALPREAYLGTPLFVDRPVMSLYVAFYRVKTKSKESFADVSGRITGNSNTNTLALSFSRGCTALAMPPFASERGDF